MTNKLGLFGGTVLVATMMAGCVPPAPPSAAPPTTAVVTPSTAAPTTAAPTTTVAVAGPHAPTISSFTASTTAAPSPLTTALRWSISDPDGNPLTCRLDLDGNGTFDHTITGCTSETSRTRTFATAGSRTVVLEVSDGTNATTAALGLNVSSASSDQYAVTLRLGSGMTPAQTSAFTSAAATWAGIVKTGQPDRTVTIGTNFCADGTAAYSGTVDDLLIDAQVIAIDGPGGILGQAGPCLVRASNGLPLYGIMQFDSADVASLEASGQFANTIVHEMGHILGIGTVWSSPLLQGAGTSNPRFTGAAAVGTWRELGGAGDVPVENTGGAGTVDSHWRETTFRTELMTGYLNSSNQLSALTAASLADLGYGVDLAGAAAYTLPALWAGSMRAHGADEHDDIVRVLPSGTA